jgi:hypothetical protein
VNAGARLRSSDLTPPAALPQFGHIRRYWDPQNDTFAAKLLPGAAPR